MLSREMFYEIKWTTRDNNERPDSEVLFIITGFLFCFLNCKAQYWYSRSSNPIQLVQSGNLCNFCKILAKCHELFCPLEIKHIRTLTRCDLQLNLHFRNKNLNMKANLYKFRESLSTSTLNSIMEAYVSDHSTLSALTLIFYC